MLYSRHHSKESIQVNTGRCPIQIVSYIDSLLIEQYQNSREHQFISKQMSIIRYKNFESNPSTKVIMMKGDTHKLYCTSVFAARGFSTNASGQAEEHNGC